MPDQKELTVGEMRLMFNGLIHEIRTGLNSAIGFAHIIANDERLPGSTVEDATLIKQSAQNTVATCNDYVDIFRLLAGELDPTDEVAQKVDLLSMIEELIIRPFQESLDRLNEQQLRQATRFHSGEMDPEELKAIQYVMHLVDQPVDDYFAPVKLSDLIAYERPDALPRLYVRPGALRMALMQLRLLLGALGGERRRLQICPLPGVVELNCQLHIPRRNRTDVVKTIDFWHEMQRGLSFSRHFDNRRLTLLALWCRAVPAGLALVYRPDAAKSCDQLEIELTLPTE